MSVTVSILMEPQDVQRYTDFLDAIGRRTARAELLPILKAGLEPLVASEKTFLADHSVSGALAASLSARSGSGDRPGTISAFSAPTATHAQLLSTWQGPTARKQQRGWAIKPKGRTRVFYGPIVHQGHRIVKRNAAGELYDTGARTQPVPFAQQAVDALGEQQADAISDAILNHIVGGA